MKMKYRIVNRKKFILSTTFLIFLCFSLLSIPMNLFRAEGFQEKQYKEIVVEPGDTLWEIAKSQHGSKDLREIVFDIEKTNHLSNQSIQPGQIILVPVPSSK